MEINGNLLKWIAQTIALVVDEAGSTGTDHHIGITRSGTSISVTWARNHSYHENVANVDTYRARHDDRAVYCATLALEVSELVRVVAAPSIPCPLTQSEKDLCHATNTIGAIKAVRQRWQDQGVNMGLRDAKDSVDAYRREAGLIKD